jgi:hypothetical protein
VWWGARARFRKRDNDSKDNRDCGTSGGEKYLAAGGLDPAVMRTNQPTARLEAIVHGLGVSRKMERR